MPLEKTIAIRVDIDTLVGLKKGVPKLLSVFKETDVRVTFFCVMGPDTMGQHAFRFKKKGYWKRILKVNPFKLIRGYGIAPFFYGTLLKSPMIGVSHPLLLKAIVAAGHELGVHGYDHAGWADHYAEYSDEQVQREWQTTIQSYRDIFGGLPEGSAAPNWRSHERLYDLEDKEGILYASDVRGFTPFRPLVGGLSYKTLQIPVTLPCTHELIQAGVPRPDIVTSIVGRLTPLINTWTVHDWFEGLSENGFVVDFIRAAQSLGYRFVTMADVARGLAGAEVPVAGIVARPVEGGIGSVTWQERPVWP